ncbi:MAG: hypothetical protein AAFR33_10415 [Pseudomonadota bacterium]
MSRTVQILTGLALLAAGTAKAMHHAATLDPMAAYWCRNGTLDGAVADTWLSQVHCWGCGAALLGAAILAHAAYRSLAGRVNASDPSILGLRPL